MPESDDLNRLRKEYADRVNRPKGQSLYSYFNTAHLYSMQQRERDVLQMLKKNGLSNLSEKAILEMGCGSGGVLIDLLRLGANPNCLVGIDLLFNRLRVAKNRLARSILANSDGQSLPFAAGIFDLAFQYTAFSSILDSQIKNNVAAEMMRVLKPNGVILWYDLWLNPANPQTRGIQPDEICRLFPSCDIEFHKITLAPPIARRIVPLSWGLALLLESLKIFNSHYLALIRPRGNLI